MSATMGYVQVAELAHALETLLDQLRIGSRQVTGEVVDALFTAADALEVAVGLSVAGRDSEIDVAGPLDRLRAVQGEQGPGVRGQGSAGATKRDSMAVPLVDSVEWTMPAPSGDGLL